MHICMYVCMYVCICTYVYMYTSIYDCIYFCIYLCIYVYLFKYPENILGLAFLVLLLFVLRAKLEKSNICKFQSKQKAKEVSYLLFTEEKTKKQNLKT